MMIRSCLRKYPGQLGCAIVMLEWAAGGCAPRPSYSIKGDEPNLIIPAIRIAVRDHDESVVPNLVKDLDNDDPAIRFYANDGLRKLTGQNFGYLYYGDEADRKAATAKWKAWLAQHADQYPGASNGLSTTHATAPDATQSATSLPATTQLGPAEPR